MGQALNNPKRPLVAILGDVYKRQVVQLGNHTTDDSADLLCLFSGCSFAGTDCPNGLVSDEMCIRDSFGTFQQHLFPYF